WPVAFNSPKTAKAASLEYTREKYDKLVKEWDRQDKEITEKPYPSASGGTRCCSRERRFVLEQITNRTALGARDDRFSALLDRVPTAMRPPALSILSRRVGLTGLSARDAVVAKPGGWKPRLGPMSAPTAVARPRSPPEPSCTTPSCR